MHTIVDFQQDMRRSYQWGATGAITSGLVWLAAAAVAFDGTPKQAVWTLFIGAAFIFPVSNVIDRLLGAAGKHHPQNVFGRLALESTVWMLMCLPGAYALSLYRMEWFFPAVLMIIGGRYLVFATIYGTKLYWLLGGLLGAAAYLLVSLSAPPHVAAFSGAMIEIFFGAALLFRAKSKTA